MVMEMMVMMLDYSGIGNGWFFFPRAFHGVRSGGWVGGGHGGRIGGTTSSCEKRGSWVIRNDVGVHEAMFVLTERRRLGNGKENSDLNHTRSSDRRADAWRTYEIAGILK